MATKKQKQTVCEGISVEFEGRTFVSYEDYFYRYSLLAALKVQSVSPEPKEGLFVVLSDDKGLLAGNSFAVPRLTQEGAIEVPTENIINPAFLLGVAEPTECKIHIAVLYEEKEVAAAEGTVTALPYDWFAGLASDLEKLAGLVRPRMPECGRILSEAGEQLRKWDTSPEFAGYEADKNVALRQFAAIYAAVKKRGLGQLPQELKAPVPTDVYAVQKTRATALDLGLFVASVLECGGLHPLLLVGERSVSVGVWLYSSCFSDSVTDDMSLLEKYASEGINNLCFIDADDLFAESEVSFTTAAARWREKLKAGDYEVALDIARARYSSYRSLPVKTDSSELLSDEALNPESAPEPVADVRLKLDAKLPRNKQWERRLLDLSFKNPLLNFNAKRNAIHILSADADATYSNIVTHNTVQLRAVPSTRDAFVCPAFDSAASLKLLKELVRVDLENGSLHSAMSGDVLTEEVQKLQRKGRESDEENGANVLYLAFGFLYYRSDDGKERYAPITLLPVRIRKNKGNTGYAIAVQSDGLQVNTTLLEYLKQEYNIDVRGLDGAIDGLKLSEIFSMLRLEVSNLKGWDVYADVYLSLFTFTRYYMWNDVRSNIEAFRSSPILSALLGNESFMSDVIPVKDPDSYLPYEVLTPLNADSSQFSAIAASKTGASFVLHGPPGTGKSQTITNIIANALHDGKTVLFVAEKQAALSVVKKRLDGIGLGDFCLELHSGKADKAEILQKIERTLSLEKEEDVAFEEDGNKLAAVKGELASTFAALHRKRRLGISVYQGIVLFERNKTAPNIMNIDSAFYDALTKEKLEECEELLNKAAVAARDCGGVSGVPFDNVNISDYSVQLRDLVYCSSQVVLAEIKHVRSYLGLFLQMYRQSVSVFTPRKAELLREIVSLLRKNAFSEYFTMQEEELRDFYRANRALDENLAVYFTRYKKPVVLREELAPLEEALAAWSENSVTQKTVRSVLKRLERTAITPVRKEDVPAELRLVLDIGKNIAILSESKFAKSFTKWDGSFDFAAREHKLQPFYNFHALCAEVFMDYNADAFNSMCVRAQGGFTRPVLDGMASALDGFLNATDGFSRCVQEEVEKRTTDDLFAYFTEKATNLIDNIDRLASWCTYKAAAKRLNDAGLTFMTDALENGLLDADTVLSAFRKHVYQNFVETNIAADPVLARFAQSVFDDTIQRFKRMYEAYSLRSEQYLRQKLVSRLPSLTTEGALSLEVMNFKKLSKSKLRGVGLKSIFASLPELMKVAVPCLLMSPTTVAEYLAPDRKFDLVIFDEASQMPTAEAVGSLARAKSTIIVGDPKQLPPTSFFRAEYVDEENPENEDMESILDDCLALGMPERHLTWHYRSRHESLIAFSNAMYYGNQLCTFPSPDSMVSKVKFRYLKDGLYDRGFTKVNKVEAEALVQEVIKRLKDSALSQKSIGVVTFSSVQKDYIERKLTRAIIENRLEEAAYEREEPLFVKNLENVQGDERDVILFSVCYGPDRNGRVSLNFGPLNQTGGWRRLNVAASRAREEMVIFSSMTSAMISLEKTSAKGVAGLKAFLEFAQRGRTSLASGGRGTAYSSGIGRFLADELRLYGYDCRYDVGVSDFKVDVAVVDPADPTQFILAILCDEPGTVYDKTVLQPETLRRADWNVIKVYSISFYSNPKREVKRIKDLLDRLTGKGQLNLQKSRAIYQVAKTELPKTDLQTLVSGSLDEKIIAAMRKIVSAEEPVSKRLLYKRLYDGLHLTKSARAERKLDELLIRCEFIQESYCNNEYLRTERELPIRYRVKGEGETEDIELTPYDVWIFTHNVLESRVSVRKEELFLLIGEAFRLKRSAKINDFLEGCVQAGVSRGELICSVADRIALK